MHSSRLLQNQMLTDFTKSFDPSGKTGAWCHHRGAWDGQAPAQPIEQAPSPPSWSRSRPEAPSSALQQPGSGCALPQHIHWSRSPWSACHAGLL